MAAKVFISYRRDDSAGQAGRIQDRLEREFGRDLLFMDVDAIPLGMNFVKVLHEEVAKCGVLLAVIGPNWLDARDEDGNRRLDNPNDFVRLEIAAALQRDIPVIPILLDGARVPKAAQLPKDLEELALRNGLDVRHASFHYEMDHLIRGLKRQSGHAPAPPAPRLPPDDHRKIEEAERGSKAWAGLDAIAGADPAFAIKPFAEGAKAAYEMIVTAFAEGNREVLRNLLSPEVFASFAAALAEREKRGEKVTTMFVSIDKVMIDDAGLNGWTAEIKIHFTAQMITATRDQAGTVIDGSPDKVVQIDDIWTFARDTRSRDPNWKLAATETAH